MYHFCCKLLKSVVIYRKEVVTILNDKLKKLRKDKNLTQQEVANKLGISRARWEHWEIGRTEPSFDYKIKIAKLFECDIGYLLNNSKIVMVEGESDVTLFNSIMRLSKNKIEEELLVKCKINATNVAANNILLEYLLYI